MNNSIVINPVFIRKVQNYDIADPVILMLAGVHGSNSSSETVLTIMYGALVLLKESFKKESEDTSVVTKERTEFCKKPTLYL